MSNKKFVTFATTEWFVRSLHIPEKPVIWENFIQIRLSNFIKSAEQGAGTNLTFIQISFT